MATVRTMSSAAKVIVKNSLFPLYPKISTVHLKQSQIISCVPVRYGSFNRSPNMDTRPIQTDVEVVNDPQAWAYVEHLISNKTIPTPTPKDKYPSGWKPPSLDVNLPYYVQRSRNHMLPVYLYFNRYKPLKLTHVTRIQGNIWAMEEELKNYLEKREKRHIYTCVNEAFNKMYIRGDHVNNIKEWMEQKGF